MPEGALQPAPVSTTSRGCRSTNSPSLPAAVMTSRVARGTSVGSPKACVLASPADRRRNECASPPCPFRPPRPLGTASVLPAETAPRPRKQYTIEQFMATTVAGRGLVLAGRVQDPLLLRTRRASSTSTRVPRGGRQAHRPDRVHQRLDLRGRLLPRTTSASSSPATRAATSSTTSTSARLDGQERDLTPGEKLKATFQGFTAAGDAFYVLTNERDPRYFDLYRYDAKTYERTLVYKDEVGYFFGDVSDDGAVDRPRQGADHRGQRHLPLRHGHARR